MNAVGEQLAACITKPILIDEPMSGHTSFHIGGPADYLAQPQSVEELQALLLKAKELSLPVTVMGNGSNLLVRDKGIRGLVIKLGNALMGIAQEGNRLTFGSGVALALAGSKAAELGLTGMEFACGIPGSIGGAVFMNAGAYDGEMAQIVTEITVLTPTNELQRLTATELDFAYRHSALQGSGLLVVSVTVELQPCSQEAIYAKMADFKQRRSSKQPLELPSAGSTFKRPKGYFAGTMIDQAGLKGYTVGGAQVSTKHAGFVVNIGGATAADVLQLIGDVQKIVQEKYGVLLEPEVLVVGEV